VWELTGSPDTWSAQLEDAYNEAPVFALLGGITQADWTPIHEFCERNRIPCLLPITDEPVLSDSDWYTLYFDKGPYQEGEAAARFLRRADLVPATAPVIQVLRDSRRGRDLARGFAEARTAMSLPAPTDLVLAADLPVDAGFWTGLVADHPGAVLALWLGPDDLSAIGSLADLDPPPPAVFLSSRLLGDAVSTLPGLVRPFAYITHPRSLPEDVGRSRLAVESWLKAKGLAVTDFDIQARMYFVGWMLAAMVKMMRDDFYRDYFLDLGDMMRDEYYSVGAIYPRLSFGPGQRYASKGCYIVQLEGDGTLERVSNWVVH
jgi:hypothetical protein